MTSNSNTLSFGDEISAAEVAAEIALHALAAPLGGVRSTARIVVLPDPAPQDRAEVVARLARQPFALHCAAEERDGVMAIECTRHTDPVGLEQRGGWFVASMRRDFGAGHNERAVLIRVGGVRLRVRWVDLSAFATCYEPAGYGSNHPGAEDWLSGISIEVEIDFASDRPLFSTSSE